MLPGSPQSLGPSTPLGFKPRTQGWSVCLESWETSCCLGTPGLTPYHLPRTHGTQTSSFCRSQLHARESLGHLL